MNFGRVLTAMLTPFTAEGGVDYAKAARLACHLAENGTDGIVLSGTTGESPTLSTDERLKLFATVKEAVGDKAKVIAGTGTNNTRAAVEMTKQAEALGVDGVLSVVPYYNKPPQEGIYRHFSCVAEATKLPVLLYNIPSRTGMNMTPETVARLSEIPNIIGLKESSGSMDQFSSIRKLVGHDFALYSGDDSLTLPLLSLGACGVVSVASHIAGPEIHSMIDLFFAGEIRQAEELHSRLLPLFQTMFITTNPIPVKAAMDLLGWETGGCRLPLLAASENQRNVIETMLINFGKLA